MIQAPDRPSVVSCPRSPAGSLRDRTSSQLRVNSSQSGSRFTVHGSRFTVLKKESSRLDTALVARGLAVSRERARGLILAGLVRVNGEVVSKAGAPVGSDANLTLIEPDHPYVGRGGVKLAHALDVFGIDVTARLALDVGASTGGFTDVLLRRGAPRVVALDVGHGQLDWKLRSDPRVIV